MLTTIRRCWLFLQIVWRPWDSLPPYSETKPYRLGWSLAWQVATIIWPTKGATK